MAVDGAAIVLVLVVIPALYISTTTGDIIECSSFVSTNLPYTSIQHVLYTMYNLKIFGILRCSGIFDHFIPNWITVIVPRVMHRECVVYVWIQFMHDVDVVEKKTEHLRILSLSRYVYLLLSVIIIVWCIIMCCSCRLQTAPRYPFSCTICRNTFQYKVSPFSLSLVLTFVSHCEGEKKCRPLRK